MAKEQIAFTTDSYIVVMTHGYVTDFAAVTACIHQPWRYLGVISSKKKKADLFAFLTKQNIKPELLERLSIPIGADIQAETPAELAVSIAAEMIRVRAQAKKG